MCDGGVTSLHYLLVSALFVFSSRRPLSSEYWDRFRCQMLASLTGGVPKLNVCSSSFLTISKDLAESVSKFMPRVLADHKQQVNSKMSFTVPLENKI